MPPPAVRAPAAQVQRLEKIVASGTRLFELRGYGRTTMDDIAEDAGITKRTLYRYVSTKQDFLLMIHEQFLDAAESLLLTEAPSASDRFREFVTAYCTVVVRHQKAVRVFFEEENNLTHEARAQVVARRDGFEARLRALLRDGQEAGEFREFDVGVVSAGIFGALAATYQWFRPGRPTSVDRLAETITGLFLTGLGNEAVARPEPYLGMQLDFPEPATDDRLNRLPPQVVDAAVRLFATKGYTETNTREIAELAQVTKGALFYYIGSKEELLHAIHRDFAVRTLHELAGWLERPADDHGDALRRVVVGHAGIIGEHRGHVRVFVDQLRYLEGERRKEVEALRESYVKGLAALLSDGQAANSFRDGDPRVAALVALGMLNSMTRWFDPAGRRPAEQVGEEYARVLTRGIQTPPR